MTPDETGPWAAALVALALAAAAAVADWLAVAAGGDRGAAAERVAKPLVMTALVGAALLAPVLTPEAGHVRPWLVAGLAASLAGDVLLLPPGRFVPGLAAFLVAHVAYAVAFLQAGGTAGWLAAGVLVALVVAATVGRVLVRAARRAGLAGPVTAYLAVITAMAVAATRTGEPAAIAGAWLFVASDALLGWGRLAAPQPGLARGGSRALGTTVMITYHAAQGLILLALVA